MHYSRLTLALAAWGMKRGMAAAITTLALCAVAQAQAPLVPMNPAAIHRHVQATPPKIFGATVLSGRSAIFTPRSGQAAQPNAAPPLPSWISVGPNSVQNAAGTVGGNPDAVSGRVAAIAVDPNTASTFYVAAAGGGVWKTTNGGQSYTTHTDFTGDTAMGSIAIAPSTSGNQQVVYAGTGEANNSGDSRYGIGLLKSTNGGASWSVIPGPSSAFVRRAISKIVVSPTDPKTVYLTVADFAVNGLGGNTGVWKTTDGGTTWTNTTATTINDSFDPYSDLVMDPTAPTTLYAAIGNPGGSGSNGIYKTTDGGTTWALLAGGLPTASVGRIALALCASAPGTIYASIENSGTSGLLGLYKTTNNGTAWAQLTAAPDYLGQQGWYDNAVVVSPTNPNQVFAGGQVNYGAQTYDDLRALTGSQDGGTTFQDYSVGAGFLGPHTDLHALAFAADGSVLLDGNDGGVWRLENPSSPGTTSTTDATGTVQWTDLNTNLDTIQFTGIALHPTDPTIAYGGSQDNGTEKYSGSLNWSQVRGGDGGFVRVDQTNPQTVYHEYYGISLERSDDGGANWNGATTGINPSDPAPDGSDPAAFYVPFKLDPANQSRVIYGTNHVYESTDKGDNFTAIGTPGTNGFNPGGGSISNLGVNGNTIYAAVGGNVYATTNDGATWADVSLPGNANAVTDIFVNPTNAQDVYVSRGAFLAAGASKIYHSTDGGATWNDVSGTGSGKLPDEPFNAVLLNPASGTLYAGGDDGVYSSTDGGTTWARLDPGNNFPRTQVIDLALSPGTNLLGAGTHGRGLFELPLSIAPYGLTATPNFTQITLNWFASVPAGATFSVFRGTSPGGESATPLATGITARTYADTQITAGVTYYYFVETVVTSGATTTTSAPSNEAFATAPATFYVPSNAYPTIQSAITAAPNGSIVQVSDGTYSGPGNVDLDMSLGNQGAGVKNLLVTSQNGAGTTIIDCGGTAAAPHRAFLFQSGETNAEVQGFTLQHANGNDEGAIRIELGSEATVLNCLFTNNSASGSGAGMYVNGTANVSGCAFTGNASLGGYQGGAAIYSNGSVVVVNSTFTGNTAASYGGALDVNSGTFIGANCLFTGNTAATGSVGVNFGTLDLINCSATQNAASGSLAVYNGGTEALTNDVFWNDAGGELAASGQGNAGSTGTATVSHCDVQGGTTGSGNITGDPRFVSPPTDLHLLSASPCIGAGTASGATTTDLDGKTRSSPPSIGAYEAVPGVLTALTAMDAAGIDGQTVTLTATLTSGGSGLGGQSVAFTVDGTSVGSATTDGTGLASLPYTIPAGDTPGAHPITAAFAGATGYKSASATATLTVSRVVTALTLGNVTGRSGQPVALTATLTRTDLATGLTGETITFTQDGAPVGTAVTNASGVATLTHTIPVGTAGGTHPLTAAFAGDNGFLPANASATLTVPQTVTALSVRASTGAPGGPITLFARLTRTDTNGGVSGKRITFTVGGAAAGTGLTDATGQATSSYLLPPGTTIGAHPGLVASFAGDPTFKAVSQTGTYLVSKVVTALTVTTASGAMGQRITLSAQMTRTDTHAGVAGKSVSFMVDGMTVANSPATTTSSGFASVSYTIPSGTALGSHTVAVAFVGDATDNAASGSGTLTVTKANTTVAVTPVSGARGTSVTLTATLTRLTDGAVLTGKMVTFTVDGASVGTGTTNSSGVATFSYAIPAGSTAGSHPLAASFAGDAGQNAGAGSSTLTES